MDSSSLTLMRIFFALLVVCVCFRFGDLAYAEPEVAKQPATDMLEVDFRAKVQPILKDLCYGCHGPEEQESGVRIDRIDGSLEDAQLSLLEHALGQLTDRSMPPEDAKQPSKAQRETVLAWVERAFLEGKRKVREKNGSVRRLTVAQYHNTLRDLLGVHDHLADVLPADGVSKEGFRNNASTQSLTPQMMQTYFEIAEKALDLCMVDATEKPKK